MSESSNKQIKILQNLPEDIVAHASSFLPIQSLLQNRVVSKAFRRTEIRSLDLDFSGIYSVRRTQSEVINIIQNVFDRHEGSEINRFVLCLNSIDAKESVASWVNTCIRKKIQKLVLDFSESKHVIDIPIDFSAIQTLTVLSLRRCRFDVPNNTPKGLKLLRILSLTRITVTEEMTYGIFRNCLHLEVVELIECYVYGILSIHAHEHKKFKSLVVSTMTDVHRIVLDAPTLECFNYYGLVTNISGRTAALRVAELHYTKRRRYDASSDMVVSNMKHYTKVYALSTTNVFLEALTKRYVGGGILEKMCTFKFENLTDLRIIFKAPTICTLYDIAEFLINCPTLQRVQINIRDFTFDPRMLFWKFHQVEKMKNNDYLLQFLNDVKIFGYKGHSHEVEIVEFFVKNAPSLVNLELGLPKKARKKARQQHYARLYYIQSIFPAVKVVQV